MPHIITAGAFYANMSTIYVQSVKTHTLSLYTNTSANFTASKMSNNGDNQDNTTTRPEEGNSYQLLISSTVRDAQSLLPANSTKLNIKQIGFRANPVSRNNLHTSPLDNKHLTSIPFLEEEPSVEMEVAVEEEEERESLNSSLLLQSPEAKVTTQTAPRTPTKEAGAENLRTPLGTPASSSNVSEVRRALAKSMTMTGLSEKRREEQREAAEERRKEARHQQLGRNLLPHSSLPRQRRNSAPSLINNGSPPDITRNNAALKACSSRDSTGEVERADPNASGGQQSSPAAPGITVGELSAAATSVETPTNAGNNRALPAAPKPKRRGKRGKKHRKSTTPKEKEGGSEEPGPSGAQHPDDVFVMPDPMATLTITREGAGADGLALVAQTLFQVPTDFAMTNPIRPIPDGAILDVCDRESADAIAVGLRMHGWTVVVTPIWQRYQFVAPALLAGSGPNDSGPTLDPLTIVRGLTTRNRTFGFPQEGLRFVSSAWEGVMGEGEREGQSLQRLRIWVDVSPEGEDFLRGHSFLLRTLSSAVRLRPATRNRQRPDRP